MGEEITQVVQAPPPPPREMAGEFDNHQLGPKIGEGMLGEVYQGMNLIANKHCVIKLFRQDVGIGPVNFGRYAHEAGLIGELGLPEIAGMYVHGEMDGRFYQTMEWVEGDVLGTMMAQGAPMSRRVYLPIMRQLCSALAAVHSFDLYHGHLHPGQVMVRWVNGAPEIKLLDFGTHNLVPGIKEFPAGWEWQPHHAITISPEQARGMRPDARSDIYALAVILYQMVTGKVPFLANTFAATLEHHISTPPPPPGDMVSIASGLEQTITRGLQKDPNRRIPSAEAMLATLDPTTVTGSHPPQGRPRSVSGAHRSLTSDTPLEPARPALPPTDAPISPPRNRLWLFVVLGVVALGCVGALVYFLLFDEEKKPPRRKAKKAKTTIPRPRPAPIKKIRPRKIEPRPAKKPIRVAVAAPEPREPAPAPKPATGESVSKRNTRRIQSIGSQLKRVAGFGTLEIFTGNRSAGIFVNGHFKGRGQLLRIPRLAIGTYRIHLVIEGKPTPHRDVQVKTNEVTPVRF